jgi:small subunit ribosomal protein S2e
VELIL